MGEQNTHILPYAIINSVWSKGGNNKNVIKF